MIIRKFLLFFATALLAGASISSAQGGPALNIPLKKARVPEGVLEGTLSGPTGVVSGASILAEPKSGGAAIPLIIDPATGRFEMKLPPGAYKLTVSAPGHATSVTEIEVKDKYRIKVPIKLKEVPPPAPAAAAPPPPAAAPPPPAPPAAESIAVRYDQEPNTGPPIDESQVSKIALAETVEFAPDEITLPPDATGLLDKLATLLSRDSTIVRLEIGGHAHPGGKGELEQRNSLRRATYVKNYLVEKGIEAPRLRIEGYGSSKPFAKGTGAEDRRKNDRVEFVLWRQKK